MSDTGKPNDVSKLQDTSNTNDTDGHGALERESCGRAGLVYFYFPARLAPEVGAAGFALP